MRVLLLEDDREIARALCRALGERGYDAACAQSCPAALGLIESERFAAAILDLLVPGGHGYDVLDALRRADPGAAVLILTARDAVADRVEGLERGADDYLVKPFAIAELLARLRALLRRPTRRVEPLRVGPLEVDPLQGRARCAERPLELTRTEFELVRCFAERRGEVLTRRHLLELVWNIRFDPGTNVVDVHVNRLRRKLEALGAAERLRTVRGLGYVLE